ncbi:MAG: glycoside hydrolase family 2 TIM barrel-domain containing protein [Sphaerochaetaceae bacterium]|nr:glycoside hydrolase family 2 TIM barrel-domain containing protein [Sphaerochaetaceae bacterium]
MKDMSYYPDPSFRREKWTDLNGEWAFAFDDEDVGLKEHWERKDLELRITVPFAYQCDKSGLADKDGRRIRFDGQEPPYHPILWYSRSFISDGISAADEILLNFNAVDYKASVWVNGCLVTVHEGGYTPFSVPISPFVRRGGNTIVVRVEDFHDDAQPRGKQIWTEKPWGCWYTPSSGIWQDVWLSFSKKARFTACRITPDLDRRMASFEIEYSHAVKKGQKLGIELSYEGTVVATLLTDTEEYRQFLHLHVTQPNSVDDVHAWCPERPRLYEVKLRLYTSDMAPLDEVSTYFGMRKVSVRNGQVLLNNRPLYQRLILDQGYWPESLLTAPDKDALERDLMLTKQMGFNGVRKHQKFESPWFYYLADKMGLLVWAELPSAYCFSTDEVENVHRDLLRAVKTLYNHPSIITWVPFNESWGIRDVFTDPLQQNFVRSVYYLLKTLDPNRLVSGNDGWEQTVTDFCAIHDYDIHDQESYDHTWGDFGTLMKTAASHRQIYSEGGEYTGEPVLLTEFGGVALRDEVNGGAWGYRDPASSKEELLARLEKLMSAIFADTRVKGFCYTQLTDVAQEVNGLLYPDRTPKCDIEQYHRIFTNRR